MKEGTRGIIENYSQDFVIKHFKKATKLYKTLHKKLAALDPKEERFARYHFLPKRKDAVLIKKLDPLPNAKKLTRAQYRYLRKSLEILHEAGIAHGDLPDNVMLDPVSQLPVIIDWDESRLEATASDKLTDNNAFLSHFKVDSPK